MWRWGENYNSHAFDDEDDEDDEDDKEHEEEKPQSD